MFDHAFFAFYEKFQLPVQRLANFRRFSKDHPSY